MSLHPASRCAVCGEPPDGRAYVLIHAFVVLDESGHWIRFLPKTPISPEEYESWHEWPEPTKGFPPVRQAHVECLPMLMGGCLAQLSVQRRKRTGFLSGVRRLMGLTRWRYHATFECLDCGEAIAVTGESREPVMTLTRVACSTCKTCYSVEIEKKA